MSDKIKASDLFDDNLTAETKKGFEELNVVMRETVGNIKALQSVQKNIAVNPLGNSSNINQHKKDITESIVLQNKLTAAKQRAAKIISDNAKRQIAEEKAIKKAIEDETKAVEKRTKEHEKANSVYQQMVKRLSDVKKELKELSVTGVTTGDHLKNLQNEFHELDGKVRKAEESTGEFQRNVGKYPNHLNLYGKGLKGFSGLVKMLTTALGINTEAIEQGIDAVKEAGTALKEYHHASEAAEIATEGHTHAVEAQVVATEAQVASTEEATVATEELNVAMEANPIGAIILAIEALAVAFLVLSHDEEDNIKMVEQFNKAMEESLKAVEEAKKGITELGIEHDVLTGKLTKNEGEILKSNLSSSEQLIESGKKYNEAKAKLLETAHEAQSGLTDKFLNSFGAVSEHQLHIQAQLDKELKSLALAHQAEMSLIITEGRAKTANIKQEDANEENKKDSEKYKKQKEAFDKSEKEKLDAYNEWADKMNKAIDDDEAKTKAKKDAAHKKEVDDWKQGQKDAEEIADGMLKQEAHDDAVIAEMEAKQKKRDEEALAEKKKRLKEEFDTTLDFAEQAAKRKDALLEKQLNNDLDMRQRNIIQQQQLAIAGRDNTLAFEKAAAAKDEKAKQDLAIKQEKREKAIAFLKLFAAYADKGEPDQALAKTLVQMAIAGAIAGSYFEGTENVGEDLKGNKMHSGKDGYVIAVDGSERVLTGDQNKMIGNMSNDELAQLARDSQSGYLPRYITDGNTGSFAQNTTNALLLNQFTQMNDRFENIEKILKSRPVPSLNIDQNGIVSKSEFRNGLIKAITHKKSSPNNMI
jgi:hypothetical protein